MHIMGFPNLPFEEAYKLNLTSMAKSYKEFEESITKCINVISQYDPNSVIILLGDHGYRIQGASSIYLNPSDRFSTKQATEDYFSTLFAIRWPNNIPPLDLPVSASHVNLWKYIFANLAEDKTILENIEPSKSYMRNEKGELFIRVEDNVVLDPPVKTTIEKEMGLE